MKRKVWAVLLALAMVVSLGACGGKGTTDEPKEDTAQKEETKEETEEKPAHEDGDIVGSWKCVSFTMPDLGTLDSQGSKDLLGMDMTAAFSFSAWEAGHCSFDYDEAAMGGEMEEPDEDEDGGKASLVMKWTKEGDQYSLAFDAPGEGLAESYSKASLVFKGAEMVLTLETAAIEGVQEAEKEEYHFEYAGEPGISVYSFHPDLSDEEIYKMSSYMRGALAVVVEDKMYSQAAGGYLASGKISKDGSDVVLEDVKDIGDGKESYPWYFQYGDGYVYAILSTEGMEGIVRINTKDDKVEMIYDQPAMYLQWYDGKLYFTDADAHYCSMDVDGKNITPIIEDRAVYYPYQVGDGWIIFQDDADGETLHIRHVGEKVERRITDIKGYENVIIGDYVYFNTTEDKTHHRLGRVNLLTNEVELSEYYNSGQNLLEPDAIVSDGGLYTLDQWNQDLDPDPDSCEEYYLYSDGEYRFYNRSFICWYAPNTNFGGYAAKVLVEN